MPIVILDAASGGNQAVLANLDPRCQCEAGIVADKTPVADPQYRHGIAFREPNPDQPRNEHIVPQFDATGSADVWNALDTQPTPPGRDRLHDRFHDEQRMNSL